MTADGLRQCAADTEVWGCCMPSSPTTTPTDTNTEPGPPPPSRDGGGGTLLLGVVLIGAGALWLLAALGVEVPVGAVAPVVLVVLGLAVVVSAVRGWDHAAVGVAVVVGIWVAIAAVVTTVVDVPLSGAMGDREHAPTTVAEAEEPERLFAGQQVLDLRELEAGDDVAHVELSTVLGELEVLVPDDLAIRVDASVAAGSIDLLGEAVDGVGLRQQVEHGDWDTASRRVDLRLRVGLGQVVVRGR